MSKPALIKKISTKLNRVDAVGIFHDSRKDVKTISYQVNILTDKINELIEVINKLSREQNVEECDATDDAKRTGSW